MLQAEEDLLVLSAQNGNHKAFNALFLKYQKPLLRFAFKLSNDQELAHDGVQDCWIKASKNLSQLRDPRVFKSWIYRMVKWRMMDLLRSKFKHDTRYTNEFNDVLNNENTLADNEYHSSKGSELSKAINQLPVLEKQIIHLFYLDEMKLVEISIILDIPVGTVKSRLYRARKLLQQQF